MPIPSNVLRSSFHHHCTHVPENNPKLRKDVAGRRLQMESITNMPNPDASLAEAHHHHNIPAVPTQTPFTLPALSLSLEKEFWEIHDIRLQGGACQSARTRRPSWTDIRIRSVTHPNSPYVPWSEDQRQCILASTDTLGTSERIPPDDFKEWVKVSGTEPALPLASGQISLTRRVLSLVLKRLRSLYSPLHTPPPTHTPVVPVSNIIDDSITTLSSIESTSLEVWLAERQLRTQTEDTAANAYTSLDEYERNGSWAHRAPSTNITGTKHDPAPSHSASRTFSLDCIPSPSPTIISFPYFS